MLLRYLAARLNLYNFFSKVFGFLSPLSFLEKVLRTRKRSKTKKDEFSCAFEYRNNIIKENLSITPIFKFG